MEILAILKEANTKKQKPSLDTRQKIKSFKGSNKKIFQDLDVFNKCDIKVENYLDVGCGDGCMSKAIGRLMGVSDDNIHGIDIAKFKDVCIAKEQLCIYDGQHFSYETNYFDFISVIQTFHHIPPKILEKVMQEIKRCLINGGYLLIKEHNCDSEAMKKLIEIEHILMDIRNQNKIQDVGNYKPKEEWDELLEKLGFEFKSRVEFEHEPTNAYFCLYSLKK